FPDLGTRPAEVVPPLRLVVVVVEMAVLARLGGRERLGASLRAVRPLGGGSEDELGSVGLQDPLAFYGEVRRDAESYAISFGGPEHRQRDPRIPGRRVEEGLVLRQTRTFGGAQHAEGGAVLDTPARIVPFGLRVQVRAARDVRRQSVEAEERSVPDEVRDARGLRRIRSRTHAIERLRSRRPPSGRGRV